MRLCEVCGDPHLALGLCRRCYVRVKQRAKEIGADSVDSSSWVRNKSWDIPRKFLGVRKQLEFFKE
jgi:hypothetical protein